MINLPLLNHDELDQYLISRLRESGFSFDSPDPKIAWEVYRSVLDWPMPENMGHGLFTIEGGIYKNNKEEDRFTFCMNCQFLVNHYETESEDLYCLVLELHYPPTESLKNLSNQDLDIWKKCFWRSDDMKVVESNPLFPVLIESPAESASIIFTEN